MECRNAIELLSPYIDGQVSGTEKVALEEHLSGCSRCALELSRLRVVVQSLREMPTIPVPRSFVLTEEMVGKRPRSIVTYLKRATIGLAAIFVLMFVTSLYMQATSYSQRTQAPMAMSARPAADSGRAMDSASTESISPFKSVDSDVRQPQLKAAPERAGAPAAAPVPSRGAASQSPEESPTEVEGSVEPRLGQKNAEADKGQAFSVGVESDKQQTSAGQRERESRQASQEPERDMVQDINEWPLLEVEIGVFVLLILVSIATLFAFRRERNLY